MEKDNKWYEEIQEFGDYHKNDDGTYTVSNLHDGIFYRVPGELVDTTMMWLAEVHISKEKLQEYVCSE